MNKSFITHEIRGAKFKQVSCIGKYRYTDGMFSDIGKNRYNSNTRGFRYNINYEITVIGSIVNCTSGYISVIGKSNDQSSTPTIAANYEITSYIGFLR